MALNLEALKRTFFDAKGVQDALDPAVRKALSKFGAFVRTRARSSIKKKKGTSKPGAPPFSHTGTLRKILFGYDARNKSVVTGPVLAGSQSGAPENLEYGGWAKLRGKSVKVKPRPFMAPAFAKELDNVNDNFRNLIR